MGIYALDVNEPLYRLACVLQQQQPYESNPNVTPALGVSAGSQWCQSLEQWNPLMTDTIAWEPAFCPL